MSKTVTPAQKKKNEQRKRFKTQKRETTTRTKLETNPYQDLPSGVSPKNAKLIIDIKKASTGKILEYLSAYGVNFEEEKFKEEVANATASVDVYEAWKTTHPVIPLYERDKEVVCEAIRQLTDRLMPEFINNEIINAVILKGNASFRQRNPKLGLDLWLTAWEHLKNELNAEMRSVVDLDALYPWTETITSWCQDLEENLGHQGMEDPEYLEKQLSYCRDFCTLLPESPELLLQNMRRGEGDALYRLNRRQEGEAVFQSLVADYPVNPWGYAGWGDALIVGSALEKTP
ncbi:hypothetical protein KJ865_05870, partial [Myxococcota bacterium]|nr:hypothetical protein [Myxococcota bacterium]